MNSEELKRRIERRKIEGPKIAEEEQVSDFIKSEDRVDATEIESKIQDYFASLSVQFKNETPDNLIKNKAIEKELARFDQTKDIKNLKGALDIYNYVSMKEGGERLKSIINTNIITRYLNKFRSSLTVPLTGVAPQYTIFVDLYGGYVSEGASEGVFFIVINDDYTYYRYPNLPDFNDKITGLNMMNWSPYPYETILFQEKNYKGRFKRFYCKGDDMFADATYNYIGDYMNNRASSALVIKHRNNEMEVGIGETEIGGKRIKDLIEKMFSSRKNEMGVHIKDLFLWSDLDVDIYSRLMDTPIITWDMWNPNSSVLSELKTIKILIPIETKIHIKTAWDMYDDTYHYKSYMKYWIYPYISKKKLKAYVCVHGHETHGDSLLCDLVGQSVHKEVERYVDKINSYLKDAVSALSGLNFKYLYLLPGDGGNHGYTEDGVIMMLQKE